MTPSEPATAIFQGAEGNRLVADVHGEADGTKPAVLLLHGGGQTRHAWDETAERLSRAGFIAYSLDQRGHGDSDWVSSAKYAFQDFSEDAALVAEALARRSPAPPLIIGASLGGVAAMLAESRAEKRGLGSLFSAIVLVDVTPRIDREGAARIQEFMRADLDSGFDSVRHAAETVSKYLPHRPRPRSHDGLKKNLRLYPDGRWRWHWDPALMEGRRAVSNDPSQTEAELIAAARSIRIPVLLVRGASSELVHEVHVKEFLELVPHALTVDVAGARHMVAGDRNDAFSNVILDFISKVATDRAGRLAFPERAEAET